MQPGHWERAIILVDMNAFFASVEQLQRPELRGYPIAITNGSQGTTIITCSYEARAYGVKTGMRLKEARRYCPSLIQVPSRPEQYVAASTRIMDSLLAITPDIEVFSVDEAFLDITRCQNLHGTPETIARMTQKLIEDISGLPCSIGLSGDKTTAKYAAKLHKPNGLTIIPPWEARDRLRDIPVTELCGIGKGVARFLANYSVYTCGEMAEMPIGILAKRFGNLGRRFWYMSQGLDPDPVHTHVADPKSMGHGKVIPPNTQDKATLLTYLLHMSEKLASRLRRHKMAASHFWIGLKCYDGWLGEKCRSNLATDDGKEINRLCRQVIENYWHGEGIHQVQVTALNPHPAGQQLDLFERSQAAQQSNPVMDNINRRYGELILQPARLLNRSSMPNVIAPAWKPSGHRQTI